MIKCVLQLNYGSWSSLNPYQGFSIKSSTPLGKILTL